MNWVIAVLAGWLIVALILGLLVGRGIRMQRGIELPVPLEAARETASLALPPRRDGVSRRERRGAQTGASSLTGAPSAM
jgi:hypothetical protein